MNFFADNLNFNNQHIRMFDCDVIHIKHVFTNIQKEIDTVCRMIFKGFHFFRSRSLSLGVTFFFFNTKSWNFIYIKWSMNALEIYIIKNELLPENSYLICIILTLYFSYTINIFIHYRYKFVLRHDWSVLYFYLLESNTKNNIVTEQKIIIRKRRPKANFIEDIKTRNIRTVPYIYMFFFSLSVALYL